MDGCLDCRPSGQLPGQTRKAWGTDVSTGHGAQRRRRDAAPRVGKVLPLRGTDPRGSRVVACGALEPTALTLLQRLLQHLAQWIGSHSTSLGFSSQGLQRGDSLLFQHRSIIHINCKPPKRSLHVCLLSCSAVRVQLFATP